MSSVLEMVLMGAVATLFMDLSAIVLTKIKIIHPPVGPEAVGRWALYTLKGKFIHDDISRTPALKNEKTAALISHYLIGIVLAGGYLLLEMKLPAIRNHPWISVIFGITTVLLPWMWLYPSIGLGFLASKTPGKSPYIVTSLVNHTNFGLGMVLWLANLRRFLM